MGIAKSGWRKNPSGGLTWTYGNYGGPGWSADEFTAPKATPDWKVPPIDELDSIFFQHDKSYQKAEDIYELSGKTGADACERNRAILVADAVMILSIEAFLQPGIVKTDDAIAAAQQARSAFLAKTIYDVGNAVCVNPLVSNIGDPFTGMSWSGVDPATNTTTTSALNWVAPRRDPLVLDLDGGGITTSGINTSSPILFDQDGDGTKTATGWIASGEAIVVRDLNGNGTVDSGRELFGDNTILTHGARAGQTAANGFEALADLDSNGDGKFDANDADFASVKLWKDLNQDGVSQAAELFSFADLGVSSINVAGTASNVNLVNGSGGATGNTQTFAGSFTKADGTAGDSGTAQLAGSLLLSNNNFYREFTDDPALTAEALALPQMTGSGLVRDLRPAMSLGTAQALDLQAKLSVFAADTTKAQQLSHLDALVQSWGNTSAMPTSIKTSTALANTAAGSGSMTAIAQFAQSNPTLYAHITALEQFNGQTILDKWVRASGNTNTVSFSTEQAALIQQAYDALKESVYGALITQTRLKPYLDSIQLSVDETGVHFDITAAVALVETKATTDSLNAVTDLIDLQKYATTTASAVGWQPYQTLGNILETTTITPELQSLLTSERIESLGATGTSFTVTNTAGSTVLGNSNANSIVGAGGSDQLYGLAGNDTLYANGSSDTLDGGAGDDTLAVTGSQYVSGTTFIGGNGNDTITGAYWNNTYVFNLGDGQDTVNNYNAGYSGYTDVLKFGAGIAATDVTPVRFGEDLVFKLAGGTDQITFKNWFADGSGVYQIEQVKFADGTVWTSAQVNAKLNVQTGTAAAETINGLTDRYNMISGLAGNDILNGANSSDYIDGGIGDDTMAGQAGNDTYIVDSVNDIVVENTSEGLDSVESSVTYALSTNVENLLLTGTAEINATGNTENNLLTGNSATNILTGAAGDDKLDGKAGADILVGGAGNDTYVLGHGYGADLIRENDATVGNTDVALFDSDIAASQLWFVHTGNDLEVSVIGTTDKLTVENWYLGSQYHVEQFKTSDGKTLLDSQVQNLVSAMAAFSPPAAGETTLSASYSASLNPVIAANWL